MASLAAELIANRLRSRPALRLILPTGHTPLGMYEALRAHRLDGSLPAERATLFQLDEYVGLGSADPRSYAAYLRRELTGIRFAAVHHIDGAAPDPEAEARGTNGFSTRLRSISPSSGSAVTGTWRSTSRARHPDAGVRRVELHPTTRQDAAADFEGPDDVPREALTVGLRTLISARELLMLVSGRAKAEALRAMLEGPAGPECPASLIRTHPRLTIVCDSAAASLLEPGLGRSSDRVVIVLGHREAGISAPDALSAESRFRLEAARRTCEAEPPRAAVLTGYSASATGLSEAEEMQIGWGGPAIPLLLENGGRNTAENASRSLPIIRAIGGIARVTVVTSAWHIRAPYFFAPYRLFGLRLSFRLARGGARPAVLAEEIAGLLRMRDQRRRALAAMRLPADLGRAGGEGGSG